LFKQLPENDQINDSHGAKGKKPAPPVAIDRSGHRLGWIERTLLAVDTDRVFIEMSDPRLREELVSTYEDEGCDVIAASSSRALLAFIEQLPIPRDFGDDVVIAEDDFPGTSATDLHRQLLARGWSIPVFTIAAETPFGRVGVAP
jgi:CheY-like chemotaxis protein